jgi:NSS family neurotransmitter:Na+ symporter
MKSKREAWSSHLKCLAAATSSSIGLGTLWRVPYTTGEHGGGAFFLTYIVCVLLVGIPLFIAELAIGRSTQLSVIPAIRSIQKGKSLWDSTGWVGIGASFLILSYYTVLAGWGLGYLVLSLSRYFIDKSPGEIVSTFDSLVTNGHASLLCHLSFIIASVSIVYAGIRRGIERWSLIVTTSLFSLLLFFFFYNCSLPGFSKAFSFLYTIDFSKIDAKTVIEALGLSLFTLSLGQGIMVTYGSYIQKEEDIPKLSITIVLMVCIVATLSALSTFPILFTYNMPPEGGIGLVFKTMPLLFSKLVFPSLFSSLFFLLFVSAALGGALALNEVLVATLIDTSGWSRKKAAVTVGCATFLCGLPSSLSLAYPTIFGNRNYLVLLDSFMSGWILPLGGLLMVLFVAFRFKKDHARDEFCMHSSMSVLFPYWYFCIRYLTPSLIFIFFFKKIFF